MKSFEDFHKELISDERWYETLLMGAGKNKDVRQAILKVFTDCTADTTLFSRPMAAHRQHVGNVLWKAPVEKKDWVVLQQPEEKKEVSEPPLTGEARAKRLAEWQAVVQGVGNNQRPFIDGQIEAEGQDDKPRKRGTVYPITPEEKIIENALHLHYIRENYDPRTGEKLSTWISEELWKDKLEEI